MRDHRAARPQRGRELLHPQAPAPPVMWTTWVLTPVSGEWLKARSSRDRGAWGGARDGFGARGGAYNLDLAVLDQPPEPTTARGSSRAARLERYRDRGLLTSAGLPRDPGGGKSETIGGIPRPRRWRSSGLRPTGGAKFGPERPTRACGRTRRAAGRGGRLLRWPSGLAILGGGGPPLGLRGHPCQGCGHGSPSGSAAVERLAVIVLHLRTPSGARAGDPPRARASHGLLGCRAIVLDFDLPVLSHRALLAWAAGPFLPRFFRGLLGVGDGTEVFLWLRRLSARPTAFWVPAKEVMTCARRPGRTPSAASTHLAFRYACPRRQCAVPGAMVVNGRERWPAAPLLKTLKAGIVPCVTPTTSAWLRDLVVDMARSPSIPRGGGAFLPARVRRPLARIGRDSA